MLKRSPFSLVGDFEDLHYQVFAHELLRGTEVGDHSALDELRREVSGLISHEVVLIDSLPQRDIAPTGANSLIRPTCAKNPIDPAAPADFAGIPRQIV